jgi:hypothetical protein
LATLCRRSQRISVHENRSCSPGVKPGIEVSWERVALVYVEVTGK